MQKKPLLNPNNLFRLYREARTYTDVLNEQFDEFQRISRNEPHPDLDPRFPRVAEGSTAAYIQQKSRSYIQQVPSGTVESETQEEWLEGFAQWVLDNEIVPNANEDYPVFEKEQVNVQDAMSFGFKVTTAPFYQHDSGSYSPDMSSAFWGDVTVPSGYKSIQEMPYVFIEGWWPQEKAKELGRDPALAEGGWNMENLKMVSTEDNTKYERSESPTEKHLGLPQHYVHVVIAYQEGVKAPIYTFSPESELILRTKPNPDPRGKKNIQVLYGLIDGTNPFGYSVVSLLGAWQNLMDNDAQAYQYNRAYNLNPATIRKGTIGDGELFPGASFDALGENDDISTIPLDTNALTEYPQIYDWQRSVFLNLTNSAPSAGDPDAPLGTTPKGIAAASALTSVDDLTYSQHIHDHWGDWAETALNIYFAEMNGVHSFTLDDKTVQQLNQLQADGKVKWPITNAQGQILVSLQGNVITLDFDNTIFPILRFKVKGGSSKLQDEAAQLEALNAVTEDINGDPELASLTGPLIKAQLYNKKLTLAGIHDDDNLMINIPQLEEQQKQEADQSGFGQKAEEAKPPTITIAYQYLEPPARVEALKAYGINLTVEQLMQSTVDPTQVVGHPESVKEGISPSTQPSTGPTQSVGVKNAVNKLAAKGVHPDVIPQAIEALTDNVPLNSILSASQGVPNAA